MKSRYVLLAIGLLLCVCSIVIIVIKGNPGDRVSLDSVSEIGEGVLHSANKVASIVTSITDAEEMEAGNRLHERIFDSKLEKELEDTPVGKYVSRVGGALTENLKRRDIKYKFHIVESFYPNAFSLPGGHIYVTIGLLNALKSESELAAVLGHEITHVDAKHCVEAIQYKLAIEKILGEDIDDFVGVVYSFLLRPGYSEVQETEADLGSVYLLYRVGYHPLALSYAFERIDKEGLSQEHKDASITPVNDTIRSVKDMVWRYFATHPAALDRIDKIKRYIADNKLIGENSKFYIGHKNYKERISFGERRFKEELRKDYIIIEETNTKDNQTESKTFKDKTGDLLNEVYTCYGKIQTGMTLAEVEEMLPLRFQVFEEETRVGYKNISIFDIENSIKILETRLWIELENDKVKGIRIIESIP
ncbi:MAG: M48 family metalloprotease [Candidatus Omnitrophota bacterium]